tara:strand:+ start:1518 stop:1967 length:450 start_codon:yes stop_codon:yes gene_type:complete
MANLTIQTLELITINGEANRISNKQIITGVTNISKRTVTCPTGQTTTVAVFASTVHGADGAIDTENSKYIRVRNLTSGKDVELGVIGAATNYQVKLAGGHQHVLGSADDLMLAEEDTDPSFGTMTDVSKIQVRNDSGSNVNVEIFIASA